MFACHDWAKLPLDVEGLSDLVTLSLVADPFGDFSPADLHQSFDVVVPFKEHFIVDLETSVHDIGSDHHRYYARKSLRTVGVELCADPTQYLEEWVGLYQHLIDRQTLTGVRAFSSASFAIQLGIPGMVMFRATLDGQTIGLDLWYVQGDVVYGHLAAYSPLGYRTRASYAVKSHVISHFRDKVRWIDLGGAPGQTGMGQNGLTQFKKGWATGTRTAFFCGLVLDADRYAAMTGRLGQPGTDYFPAYRVGEFGQ